MRSVIVAFKPFPMVRFSHLGLKESRAGRDKNMNFYGSLIHYSLGVMGGWIVDTFMFIAREQLISGN